MAGLGILIALVAAYWVYTDARRRGQDNLLALLWAGGTLAALVIFLPLYLLLGRREVARPRADRQTIDVEATVIKETINCPMCGEAVDKEVKVCPHCGHTMQPKCSGCGRDMEREWRVCPYCQTPAPPK